MKTYLRRFAAVAGFIMLLAGTAFVANSLALAVAWLAVSVSLLFAGRTFTFQQKT